MPLKLIPPQKTPGRVAFAVHGTYLGVRVRQSTRSDKRQVALDELKRIEREIEKGRFSDGPPAKVHGFADAALGYLRDCGDAEVHYVKALLQHFRETPLADFTTVPEHVRDGRLFGKDLIDAGEAALYPPRLDKQGRPVPYAAGTLNRHYRAPLAAVLHHASKRGLCAWVKVEKHREEQNTKWLEPDLAARLIAAARTVDAGKAKHHLSSLAALLVFLFATGARTSEAVNLLERDLDLPGAHAVLRKTKNGETYGVHMSPVVVAEIANMRSRAGGRVPHPESRVFGYSNRRSMRWALKTALKRAGITGFTMHQARHSFATWLRRDGADLKKIMELGRWKDARSALRYQHVASHEQVEALGRLPLSEAAISAGGKSVALRDRRAPGKKQNK